MDLDSGFELTHEGGNLEELDPDSVDRGVGQLRPLEQVGAQGMEKDIGGGMQEEAELIGLEAMAGGTIRLEVEFVLLDTELVLTAGTVDVAIEDGGVGFFHVGDHKAYVSTLLPHFYLGHNPAGCDPLVGLIIKRVEQGGLPFPYAIDLRGSFDMGLDFLVESGVSGKAGNMEHMGTCK